MLQCATTTNALNANNLHITAQKSEWKDFDTVLHVYTYMCF